MSNKINRRDFLKFVGAGTVGAGAGFLAADASKMSTEFLIPQVNLPEDYSPGIATWYNTVCTQCSAGCGISVRTREGRAKKIEGNRSHPVNEGRLCALGQAGLNVLYNPDRIRTPLLRDGERGSGSFSPISWDEALTTISGVLGTLKIQEKANNAYLLSGSVHGHLNDLFALFMDQLGSENYWQHEFSDPASLYAANKACFDVDVLPFYDIRNSKYLLSFGADYLGAWLSPVHYGVSYGHLRQGTEQRGRCVQVEPRMSLSGANADEWVEARPGSEGMLALAMAHSIVEQGLYSGGDAGDWKQALGAYSPASVAERSGISADRIVRIATEFASASPSLAIGGGAAGASTNGTANLVAVNVLNHIGGNIGEPGGILFNPASTFSGDTPRPRASYQDMLNLFESLSGDDAEVLILHDTNPVFTLPSSANVTAAVMAVPYVIGMSSFMDETMALADIILPLDTYLEAWGDSTPDPGVGFAVASIGQPVVKKLYDTRSAGDIILALAHQIGGELPANMPWTSMENYLMEKWRAIYQSKSNDSSAQGFREFWSSILESGVWGERPLQPVRPHQAMSQAMLSAMRMAQPSFAGNEGEYRFVMQPYLSLAFQDGRGANLPWMQELPDPLTSVVYNSWVELNPKTAAELGIREGDVLLVESTAGRLEAPAFIYQAIRPDVVAMPIGQGHGNYGRYASGRGSNPIEILAPEIDIDSGGLAWSATRVKISKTGRRVHVIKTDGTTRELGRNILGQEHGHA
ncbi:MAG: molybdopterin-dependent oxidoreductase [Gammaproteobacteria bacterium]|nr:molybdopterin-dependent oxidoreductase [Gammaproteobacteria bacterium]MCZ6912275.1 molybdopterin-dependent oxidoreductase [Pseudomonadota bacterium]